VVTEKSLITPSLAGTVRIQHDVPNVTLGAPCVDCKAHAPDNNNRLDDAAAAARITARFAE
jgi:hypothetical protein